ncbi:MAG: hypothetical protein ACQGVK_00625 [Myxococcota bacterium]
MATRTAGDEIEDRGPGPFVTHRVQRLPGVGHLVTSSRRHRKGLRPHRVSDAASAERPRPTRAHAFRHLWAPGRLAWWIAILFTLGAALFTLGGIGAAWPGSLPPPLRPGLVLNRVFAVGAVFFTSAAWLQWLEALNGDVADAFRDAAPRRWRWFGWRPRNLGYLASAVQLAGTLMFNVDTLDALLSGLSWEEEDLLVWTPNMSGCACFLVASYLAYVEVSQRAVGFAVRSVSWWIAVANLSGSVAFQISALYAFVGPSDAAPEAIFRAGLYTAAGGACFLVGSYLMIPELADEDEAPGALTASKDPRTEC